MTAVIQPLLPRNGWSDGAQPSSSNNMSADGRSFVPRKITQRSNSSSSLASLSSLASTITATTSSNQINGVSSGDGVYSMGSRKKSPRGVWPTSSKVEPIASISTARSQPIPAQMSGTSAASSVSALHNSSSQALPLSIQPQNLSNGTSKGSLTETTTVLQLQPLNGTFERKAITIPCAPDVLRIGRQTNQKTLPTTTNGYFDSKVLSRQHAEIWSDRDGKINIRDVGSSNGTFVNGRRLSAENKTSETERLKEGDILELGIDIVSEDQKTIVHHKVAARIDYAGFHATPLNDNALSFGDLDSNTFNNPNARGRTNSQGGVGGNGRYANGKAIIPSVSAATYHSKWLQPVTMEHIVKRLTTEIKQARHQASDIHSITDVMGALIQDWKGLDLREESDDSSQVKASEGLKARFSNSPPAPPPLQPLPEAPKESPLRGRYGDLSSTAPILQRMDTERPRSISSLGKSADSHGQQDQSTQISNLIEALSNAHTEIAAQNRRISDMESALHKERESRRTAEERATRLEISRTLAGQPLRDQQTDEMSWTEQSGALDETLHSNDVINRMKLMRVEMDEMKILMARYQARVAIAEKASRQDRHSLSELVEIFKRKEEIILERHAELRQTQKESSVECSTIHKGSNKLSAIDRVIQDWDSRLAIEFKRAESQLQPSTSVSEGRFSDRNDVMAGPVSIAELQRLGKAAIAAAIDGQPPDDSETVDATGDECRTAGPTALKHRVNSQMHLVQTAPYASLIGVVLLGVGMMAYLNGWQKIAER